MSEGKYGRLPKPKDRSKGVHVELGEVTLTPTHDKASEWAEEDDSAPHAKRSPEESTLTKLSRFGQELGAAVSHPWSRFLKKDDDE